MTTCILSGFAKPKKYVGVIYACDGSDLPATQDFGTVQYQGPFEAAQTVPETTVSYTIIGKTPCGDTVRRITTRTYSSRAVAGMYANNIAHPYIAYHPDVNVVPLIPAISAHQYTLNEIYDLANSLAGTPWIGDPGGGSGYGTWAYSAVDHKWSKNGSAYIYTIFVVSGSLATPVTGYYLDVHEVWTYDLL